MRSDSGHELLSHHIVQFIVPQRDKPKRFDGQIPWCRIEDIDGIYLSKSRSGKGVTPEVVAAMPLRVFPKGTVIVSCSADLGRCAIVETPLVTNQTFIGLVPDVGLDSKYLYYLMTSMAKELNAAATGATIKYLSKDKFKSIPLIVPSLAEQQRIVAILDQAFAAIAKAKANAEQNLKNAKELFESYLQGVFSQLRIGWNQKTLAEVATTFGRGKSKHRPRNEPRMYGGKYPFIQTGDIRNADHFITEYSQTYNEAGLAQSMLWPKGTICITIAANIAETAILSFDACFPDSVIGIVANPKEADVGFIEYVLQSFKARIQALGKGSAQSNINMGTFENELFPFPPVAEQKQIVNMLDALWQETQRLFRFYEQKLAALEELKKSILHQAFEGEY